MPTFRAPNDATMQAAGFHERYGIGLWVKTGGDLGLVFDTNPEAICVMRFWVGEQRTTYAFLSPADELAALQASGLPLEELH